MECSKEFLVDVILKKENKEDVQKGMMRYLVTRDEPLAKVRECYVVDGNGEPVRLFPGG
jgi:hypothetical protein